MTTSSSDQRGPSNLDLRRSQSFHFVEKLGKQENKTKSKSYIMYKSRMRSLEFIHTFNDQLFKYDKKWCLSIVDHNEGHVKEAQLHFLPWLWVLPLLGGGANES